MGFVSYLEDLIEQLNTFAVEWKKRFKEDDLLEQGDLLVRRAANLAEKLQTWIELASDPNVDIVRQLVCLKDEHADLKSQYKRLEEEYVLLQKKYQNLECRLVGSLELARKLKEKNKRLMTQLRSRESFKKACIEMERRCKQLEEINKNLRKEKEVLKRENRELREKLKVPF
ncbi:hypothetical protein EDD75_0283 [Thermodesulfitimonas autotrophica]|uniref:Uncharacterized protein n=1 Tax=Thermodesulfitimonas autotrophica TaxID=1894989 RepID=A0A3N5BIH7_9THEO|nr:hypothetical protein [Thermodesulfitimonas autotrophica]RPF49468.1 hypothetical protein EDD75_0283 [Thermodesulfitimonas autotrophica]